MLSRDDYLKHLHIGKVWRLREPEVISEDIADVTTDTAIGMITDATADATIDAPTSVKAQHKIVFILPYDNQAALQAQSAEYELLQNILKNMQPTHLLFVGAHLAAQLATIQAEYMLVLSEQMVAELQAIPVHQFASLAVMRSDAQHKKILWQFIKQHQLHLT